MGKGLQPALAVTRSFTPVFFCRALTMLKRFSVLVLLALLGAATEQDDHAVAILAKIDSVAWAEVDLPLEHARTDALHVRTVAGSPLVQRRRNLRRRRRVEAVEPGAIRGNGSQHRDIREAESPPLHMVTPMLPSMLHRCNHFSFGYGKMRCLIVCLDTGSSAKVEWVYGGGRRANRKRYRGWGSRCSGTRGSEGAESARATPQWSRRGPVARARATQARLSAEAEPPPALCPGTAA